MSGPAKDDREIALRRIADERQQRTGTLDLSSLHLEAIPEEVYELNHLETLLLGSNLWSFRGPVLCKLSELSPAITRLQKLRSLHLDQTRISDLRPLSASREARDIA